MSSERLFLVSYDIADQKRLRKIAALMEGYGYRIQFSVFVCHLTPAKLEALRGDVSALMNDLLDQCLFVDLGPQIS